MKWKIVFWIAAIGFTGLVWAKEVPQNKPGKPTPDFMVGTQVWFEGNSSLGRFYFTAGEISAKGNLNRHSKMKTLLAVILNREGHKLTLTLPVKGLKSGNSEMDGIAHEKLESVDFPNIVFTMGDYVVKAYPGSLTTYALLVSGKLRIAGVERDVILEPTMVLGKDGIKIYVNQDVYQKDYGISPYSVAAIITTENKIVVHCMISLGLR